MVVGLGNPGEQYRATRHNLGFRVVEHLAETPGVRIRKPWFSPLGNVQAADARFRGKPLLLVKPLTHVNRSGEAVKALAARFRLPPPRILVVCDDLALPPGILRLRTRGSSGGHNGLQSIIDRLGEEFPRLRLGIGGPVQPSGWADYVLSPFSEQEETELPGIISRAVADILSFVSSMRQEEQL